MAMRFKIGPRAAALAVLLLAIGIAAYHFHRLGSAALLSDRDAFRQWIVSNAVAAPLIFIGAYVVCTTLLLPVWWIQVLAGYCFGLAPAVIVCQSGAVAGAALSSILSRWLAADWFHSRVEGRMARLRALDQRLGHNGFLVVSVVRLTHVSPFGISNYLFGLLEIRLRSVVLGTLIGGIPTTTFYAALGTGAPVKDWRFLVGLGIVNGLLLVGSAIPGVLQAKRSRKTGEKIAGTAPTTNLSPPAPLQPARPPDKTSRFIGRSTDGGSGR